MIYFVVLFLIFLCVYAFDYRKYSRLNSFSYWAIFVILVLIAGFRYRIGTDSIVYENAFSEIYPLWQMDKFDFDSTRFEPGFLIFASIPRIFSDDFTVMQIFEALIVNFVIFWFILKNTNHKFLCLSFYYLILYLNLNTQVMREALAVSLFLLAWPSFRDGKWWWYYGIMIFATFMHTSAALTLFLPLFCLPGVNYCFRLGKRTIPISLAILAFGFFLQTKFYSLLKLLSSADRVQDLARNYEHQDIGGGVLNLTGIVTLFLTTALFPLLALYFTKQKTKKDNDPEETARFKKLEIMVMTGYYLTLFAIPIFILVRYNNYFGMFYFVLIASWVANKVVVRNKVKKVKFYYWVLILFPYYFLNFYSYFASANKSGTIRTYTVYYPYSHRLDPQRDPAREAAFRYFNVR